MKTAYIKHLFLWGCILCALQPPLHAQSPQFSQYYAAPLLIAPSFAGNSLGSRAFINYRDQWAKLPGSFVTYSVALDNNFYAINSGIGLVFLRDIVGAAKYGNTMIKGLYSYRFNVTGDWRIRPGVYFAWEQRSMNFSSAVFPDQIWEDRIDPVSSLEPQIPPYSFFDAGASAVVYNSRMWIGLTVDHLMRPETSLSRMNNRSPMQWSQFGGFNFKLNRGLGKPLQALSVNYLFKTSRNFYQFDAGVNWIRAPMMLGLAWRGLPAFNTGYASYDAAIFSVGYAFRNVSVGYSYDFTISSLGPATGGSHEITVSISFNEGAKKDRKGSVPCPDVVRNLMFGADKEFYR
ncbi:MAG: PorP/SprF family type IX secretion system membrane protein [Bacteroidales bacterium]|jgi:type IX secretion system PorP/SprF family membrane protein|nr:PorP/SprF family type IX secretion system membrane protein [Bacteroidales bacterium]